MNSDEIKKAREIIDAATPGPWTWDHDAMWSYKACVDPCDGTCGKSLIIETESGNYPPFDNDRRYITAAREGWPKALDEIEKINDENANLKHLIMDSELKWDAQRCALKEENQNLRDEIEELKKAHADQMIVFAELCDEQKRSETLEAENQNLRATLEFYASEWRSDVYIGPTDEMLEDFGQRAREALK